MLRLLLLSGLVAVVSTAASAQISIGGSGPQTFRVQGTIGIGNGESCVTIANPNSAGQFLFLFPHMAPLKPGEQMPLRLHAVGQEGQTVFVWKADAPSSPAPEVVAGGQQASTATVHHTVVPVEIPAMLANTSTVVRLDVPGIKAGSAVSVSPSEELPGMLAIAHASAPVDCVVIIKFINPGPFIPGLTMPMSLGAVGAGTMP
jgi:hypothetical protein